MAVWGENLSEIKFKNFQVVHTLTEDRIGRILQSRQEATETPDLRFECPILRKSLDLVGSKLAFNPENDLSLHYDPMSESWGLTSEDRARKIKETALLWLDQHKILSDERRPTSFVMLSSFNNIQRLAFDLYKDKTWTYVIQKHKGVIYCMSLDTLAGEHEGNARKVFEAQVDVMNQNLEKWRQKDPSSVIDPYQPPEDYTKTCLYQNISHSHAFRDLLCSAPQLLVGDHAKNHPSLDLYEMLESRKELPYGFHRIIHYQLGKWGIVEVNGSACCHDPFLRKPDCQEEWIHKRVAPTPSDPNKNGDNKFKCYHHTKLLNAYLSCVHSGIGRVMFGRRAVSIPDSEQPEVRLERLDEFTLPELEAYLSRKYNLAAGPRLVDKVLKILSENVIEEEVIHLLSYCGPTSSSFSSAREGSSESKDFELMPGIRITLSAEADFPALLPWWYVEEFPEEEWPSKAKESDSDWKDIEDDDDDSYLIDDELRRKLTVAM